MSTAPRNAAAKRDWGHDETGCTVLHIDMDAFYASLEIARNPELRGRPVIIGWPGPRSVVSAANYEARKYGVNSAMPMVRAKQLCPGGAYVRVDMPYYREMSKKIFDSVFRQVTDQIEQVSVDEGYMDVSSALLRWKSPSIIGAWIRAQVAAQFDITCSVGIAANKLVAKMASTNAKPDGMLLIPKARHAEFVQMMPLRGIPGIGPSLEKRLNEWGVKTVADLADMDETALLQATRSKITAHNLYLAARGQDERPIVTHAPEKSIGAEITFEQDTRDASKVRELLHHCSNEVTHTLRKKGLVARTVNVKLRFADMSYSTKAHTLERPIDTAAAMYPESVALLKAMLKMPADAPDDAPLPREVRLAGVSASSLSDKGSTPVQLTIEDMLGSGADGGTDSGSQNGNTFGSNKDSDSNGNGNATCVSNDNSVGNDNDHISSGNGDEHAEKDSNRRNDSAHADNSRNTDNIGDLKRSSRNRIRSAETVLDAVRDRYGTGAASLGLEHGDWKAKQIANNSKPEP
ncbi:DNA polymerase IV [Bifidobacterium sp. ESL0732]|uniref:DNA polymerase IV n=1 Tax=Bifidobacterium sp. ESL0732 TaxID=2983222 RepID=UPI0023F7AA78|nr:DNA polymerase IV [Bifidobacterium sp. ESL0732]WEV64418.1 DNA polymerase IV [Bifidobacterium sp. ESL0732]